MVSVIGYPFGLLTGGLPIGIWATGFVASEPDFNAYGDMPTMLIDCRTRQGQSGAPVLAFREGGAVSMTDGSTQILSGPAKRFLGIYSGRINDDSDLGIVWKASPSPHSRSRATTRRPRKRELRRTSPSPTARETSSP